LTRTKHTVPVSALLLSKLIKERFIHLETQNVCILAMAGISHGPFPSLKSSLVVQYIESDPAKQLFDFNLWNSTISMKYREAMVHLLGVGVRVVAVGSWYDQVVPVSLTPSSRKKTLCF
jgi:hypothetical protein